MHTPTELERRARQVLEEPFWITELKTDIWYIRLHDDHDGTKKGKVAVMILENGDCVISNDSQRESLRFRTMGGGGNSLRVRNALMILALAIKLDNDQKPTE